MKPRRTGKKKPWPTFGELQIWIWFLPFVSFLDACVVFNRFFSYPLRCHCYYYHFLQAKNPTDQVERRRQMAAAPTRPGVARLEFSFGSFELAMCVFFDDNPAPVDDHWKRWRNEQHSGSPFFLPCSTHLKPFYWTFKAAVSFYSVPFRFMDR